MITIIRTIIQSESKLVAIFDPKVAWLYLTSLNTLTQVARIYKTQVTRLYNCFIYMVFIS